ncbi:MAG: hypothetical protein KDK23_00920 [Leptospiraceae bacterium]|nr:hypothetical protein [Leptospiraceae bacterium]
MTVANCTMAGSGPAPHHPSSTPWIVHPGDASSSIQQAILLDARFYGVYVTAHIAGATHIAWKDFSRKDEERGMLLAEQELQARLSELGVQKDSLVFVYGGARNGWGEEGRIVWMLREAGIRNSYLVDGGYQSLVPYLETSVGPMKGDLTKKNRSEPSLHPSPAVLGNDTDYADAKMQEGQTVDVPYTISREELGRRFKADDIAILDVREKVEYQGQTPYGESRGGHIPGAKHIYFQDFLDPNGYSLSKAQIRQLLLDHGIREEQRIVPYCTGGVRSAMVTALLRHHGFKASNFAGSMWFWSAGDPDKYPLEKEP